VRSATAVLLLAIASLASIAALPGTAGAAARRVPHGFFGTDGDGPLFTDPSVFEGQLDPMVSAGVESLRLTFDWRKIQPYASFDDVPPDQTSNYQSGDGGVPTDFSFTDGVVADAAQHGMTVLPVLLYVPTWAARYTGKHEIASPPKDPGAYARFASSMVHRYGTSGSFWSEHPEIPRMPIRMYQIWNEPHFDVFWWGGHWARRYVKLLRRAYAAVHAADSSARVVLSGLANKSWHFLARIYARGGRGHFDYVAVHPFTAHVKGVATILRRVRRVMRRHHDRRLQLLVTELSWTSARGKTSARFGIEETERGQARKLRQAYRMLAKLRRRLRLHAVYWYTWMTLDRSPSYPFDYAGVTRREDDSVVRKPAYRAMRKTALTLEGCASKTNGTALVCDP